MRKTQGIVVVFLTMIFVACTASRGQHSGGDTAGNGGDGVVLDFVASARHAASILTRKQAKEITAAQLVRKINAVHIESTDERLYVGKVEKDVLNYPEHNRIVVNRSRWQAIDEDKKPALALHEFLGLLRIEDSEYQVSSRLLDFDPETLRPLRQKVDILIVVDDSGSMATYQSQLASHVDKLWEEIRQKSLDFQIGVITSTNSQLVGTTKLVTPYTPDGLEVLQQNIQVGEMGSGTEMFFKPVEDAVQPGANPGLIRPQANLEIVFLTDADDQSENIEPLQMSQFLWNLKGSSKMVFAYGILALSGTTNCQSDAGYPPNRLVEFINQVNGDLHSICSITPTYLKAMGQQISSH